MAVLFQSLAFVFMAPWFKLGGSVVHPLTRRYKAWRNMELNCLIDSELLSLNQSFDDAYIEMLFLLESEQK
ncbi:hypothetical protein CGK58_23985, partial [Vibrio parahaemolyticus]